MGEREDILRRFAERVRDGRWAVDTGYKSVHQAARAALREADALPPDDAQPDWRYRAEVAERAVDRLREALSQEVALREDAQQRLDQIAALLDEGALSGFAPDRVPYVLKALRLARGEAAS